MTIVTSNGNGTYDLKFTLKAPCYLRNHPPMEFAAESDAQADELASRMDAKFMRTLKGNVEAALRLISRDSRKIDLYLSIVHEKYERIRQLVIDSKNDNESITIMPADCFGRIDESGTFVYDLTDNVRLLFNDEGRVDDIEIDIWTNRPDTVLRVGILVDATSEPSDIYESLRGAIA